jgi:hypothetical protein
MSLSPLRGAPRIGAERAHPLSEYAPRGKVIGLLAKAIGLAEASLGFIEST